MLKRSIAFAVALLVGPLFSVNVAVAQVERAGGAYLNFEQFETVVEAGDVSFIDKLKWAGMKLVNSPAAKRVVSLYDYDAGAITEGKCSDDQYKDYRALVVNSALSSEELIKAVEEAGVSMNLQMADVGKSLGSKLKEKPWITQEAWINAVSSYGIDIAEQNIVIPEPKTVWHELPYSNGCQLQRTVASFDYDAVVWQQVFDPKLLSITQLRNMGTGKGNALDGVSSPHLIVTDPIVTSVEARHYFAECMGRVGYLRGDGSSVVSLCGEKEKMN